MKQRSGSKKVFRIVLIALASLLALVALVLAGAHLLTPVVYGDFFDGEVAEFKAAGLGDGLVPQGFAYVEQHGVYLQCGYMADGSASRIYVIDERNDHTVHYVTLLAADGTAYTGHTGGLTAYDDLVWLVNDGEGEDNCVWVLSLSELLSAPNGGTITLNNKFQPESRAAYCLADGEYLWVGEFYRAEDYPTKASHTFTVADGAQQNALVCAYPLDTASELGIADTTPALLLSVPGQVQGFAMTADGGFVLSSSFGLSSSILRFYSALPAEQQPDATLDVNGASVPVYFLDNDMLIRVVEAPPMSEEIVVKDGRLFVLFESACQKYIFGNFMRGRPVYSIPMEQK